MKCAGRECRGMKMGGKKAATELPNFSVDFPNAESYKQSVFVDCFFILKHLLHIL